MRALLPSDVDLIEVPPPTESVRGLSLRQHSLRTIGERLRATYDAGEGPLPARLHELVERLGRRERAKN